MKKLLTKYTHEAEENVPLFCAFVWVDMLVIGVELNQPPKMRLRRIKWDIQGKRILRDSSSSRCPSAAAYLPPPDVRYDNLPR